LSASTNFEELARVEKTIAVIKDKFEKAAFSEVEL